MKLSILTTGLLTTILLASCGGQSLSSDNSFDEGWAQEFAEATEDYFEEDRKEIQSGGDPIPNMERKLIKEANLSYETQELDSTQFQIEREVKKYGGYISAEERYFSYDRENISITARIPIQHFEDFLTASTAGVIEFENQSISAQDVTEEYVDIQARIKTKKEVEQQYINLLDKAVNVTEIMEIERELGYIREEIESAEGRLKYLENSSAYSTIHFTAFKLVEVPSKYSAKFSNSFKTGWDGFVMLFVGLTALWPLLIVGSIIFFMVRAFRRKQKKFNKSCTQP